MAKRKSTPTIKLFYDEKGRSLSVWFDDPKKEVVSEELGEGLILSKDRRGKMIGFEKLYVKVAKQKRYLLRKQEFLEKHL